MEGYSRKGDGCPQLLDLMSKQRREWLVKREEETNDEKTLELSLGPPGGNWTTQDNHSSKNHSLVDDKSLLSFSYFSNTTSMTQNRPTTTTTTTGNHQFPPPTWSTSVYQVKVQQQQQQAKGSYLQLQSSSAQGMPAAVKPKESSQPCCTKVVDLQASAEKKAFSPAAAANTALPNSAHKRTAPAPVVGWPPIRSFRKNLASSSSLKSASETPTEVPNKGASEKHIENGMKGLFVKINMDGIPIGRKVDLKAYDSYEKLSAVVDELFRGLLAAQSDSSTSGIQNKDEGEKAITGLLDGSGEYTLVYEDNEGDRMLVGDVPWHMFVSTVKRLRVLKSSEIPLLRRGSKQGKHTT